MADNDKRQQQWKAAALKHRDNPSTFQEIWDAAESTEERDALLQLQVTDVEGTALLLASGHGHAKTVRWLLEEAKADVNSVSPKGATPLILACFSGDTDTVKCICAAGGDVHAKCEGLTPLHFASVFGFHDVAVCLVEAGADVNRIEANTGCTALHAACLSGCIPLVKFLLESGIDRNVKSTAESSHFGVSGPLPAGSTALDYARAGSSREMVALLEEAA